MKRKSNRIRPITAVFGIVLVIAGLSWIGRSAGILPQEIDVFKYLCPAFMVMIGIKIAVRSLIVKAGDNSCGREM